MKTPFPRRERGGIRRKEAWEFHLPINLEEANYLSFRLELNGGKGRELHYRNRM